MFLERAELGSLIEAETDWHRTGAAHRPAPADHPRHDRPAPSRKPARAWVETLFG